MVDFNVLTSKNADSLDQYREFLSACTESDLTIPMPAGWTVSAVLVHLAFWDQRVLTLMDKWEKDGISFSAIDTDVVNEITRHLCLAIPPKAAVDLFLNTAKTLDDRIAKMTPETMANIEENGKNVHLNRAAHREIHMKDIKTALRRS